MSLPKINRSSVKFLITGTASGLGRYLLETLGGTGFTRNNAISEYELFKKEGVDTIIHCAFNSRQNISGDALYSYLDDNIFLTERLVAIPHRVFIFISSVDVYPGDKKIHTEEDPVSLDDAHNAYSACKIISESIIQHECPHYAIFRCGALLGPYMRENSLIKVLKGDKITLSGDSSFSYVLSEDVERCVRLAALEKISGIYNLVSSGGVTLNEVSKIIGHPGNFGEYIYTAGRVNNKKIIKVVPEFKKTSGEVVRQFIKIWNK